MSRLQRLGLHEMSSTTLSAFKTAISQPAIRSKPSASSQKLPGQASGIKSEYRLTFKLVSGFESLFRRRRNDSCSKSRVYGTPPHTGVHLSEFLVGLNQGGR
jgi:hypothetical protein